jgi:hypothetical protein
MLTTPSLILFFLLGLVFGCWRAYRLLITNRHPTSVPSALYQWEGMRLSSWKYQPQVSWAILVHLLATIALVSAGLYTARKPSLFNRPPFTTDKTMVSLDWFIEGGSMAVIGYLLGALLAFPLASFEKKPVTYAVSEEGMIYGKSLMPWAWFSLDSAPVGCVLPQALDRNAAVSHRQRH